MRELQQIASNYQSDTEFKDFMKLYKGYAKASFSFLVTDTALSSDNSLRFRKNLLQNDCKEKIKTKQGKIEQNKA